MQNHIFRFSIDDDENFRYDPEAEWSFRTGDTIQFASSEWPFQVRILQLDPRTAFSLPITRISPLGRYERNRFVEVVLATERRGGEYRSKQLEVPAPSISEEEMEESLAASSEQAIAFLKYVITRQPHADSSSQARLAPVVGPQNNFSNQKSIRGKWLPR